MKRRPTRRRRGIALLEVLGALSFFAVMIVSHFTLLMTTTRVNARAQRMTAAASLAEDKLEELRGGPRTNGADAVTSAGEGPDYTREWAIGAGPAPATSEVTVSVSWPEGTRTHAVELVTVLRD